MANPSSAPDAIFSSYEDLTPELRICSEDIFNAARAARSSKWLHIPDEQDRTEIWDLVFRPLHPDPSGLQMRRLEPWDTSKPIPQCSLPPPAKHLDLRIRIGFFTQDLPASSSARRNAAKNSRHYYSCKVATSRRRFHRAYLQARFSQSTQDIEWFWSDDNGKGADPKYIAFRHPDSEAEASRETVEESAILRADVTSSFFTERRNKCLAAHWIRCRLLRELGRDSPQRVANPSAADFVALEKVVSLRSLARTSPNTSSRLKRLLEQSETATSKRMDEIDAEIAELEERIARIKSGQHS